MLLYIQILSIVAVTFGMECPPKDKLVPCTCVNDEGLVTVNCENLNSILEIEPAVKNTIGYNVSFGIYRSHLGDIPTDFFKGHTPVKIIINECVVTSYGDKPFSGLENSLQNLHFIKGIDRSAGVKLDAFSLSHLQSLKYVIFSYNDITEVGNNWFKGGPKSLRIINFIGDEIEKLGDNAFTSLKEVQQFYLRYNKIKSVTRSMFPNPGLKTYVLDFQGNKIEQLPSDIFEGFPILEYIDLSGNNMKSIPENVFGKVWSKLKMVNFSGNDIVCDENLKWIYKQKLPDDFQGKCGPGNDLHNKDLNSLKLEDFQ